MSLMSKTTLAFGRKKEGQAAIIALTKTTKDDENPTIRAAAAEVLKKLDPEFVAKAREAAAENPREPEMVAKAFLAALANKNVAEAINFIIPEEREEFKKALDEHGMAHLPKDPIIKLRLKENGTQADLRLINPKKPGSGEQYGFDMKFSNGKWWITK